MARLSALDRARAAWPGITFDWSRGHPAVTEAFLREFLRQAARFPEVAAKMEHVSVVRFTAAGVGNNGYAYPDGTRILVNTAYARDPYRAKDAARLCRHEFGHQVLHYLEAHPAVRDEYLAWRRRQGGEHAIIAASLERGRVPRKVAELFARLRGG
jgi:hypothetical protein